ncbi:hypothetical protein D9757_002748 [Collybiopsis confluens]|uniref:Uncharacterized protein n=1 Tax=Collybiopsis confluens TaxID=2823264 RepID=A0A8H5MDQ4_9AGAR|nr:hypothetical protein D9757_002748 [Collybiopsis confluens]
MFIVSDILSLLPASNAGVRPQLEIGRTIPPEVQEYLQENTQISGPTMIYIPRHCGCPFPERDLHHLYAILSHNLSAFESSRAQIFVLPHARTSKACQDWFDLVFAAAAAKNDSELDSSRQQRVKDFFHVVPDPAPRRTLAKALSFGTLDFSGLFSRKPLSDAWNLRKTGIKNRDTAAGSNRWLEHGAIWISSEDEGSVVKWVEKPAYANTECDWMKGWKQVGLQI